MRRFLLVLLTICSLGAYSQYTNTWINHNNTYYKFKIAKDSLYRITQPQLAKLGLANVEAQHFQLWRNGEQQPLYISKETGTLSSSDYIEFWGKKNDGKPDKKLYRNADYQLDNYYSLFTDTAAYFLTVNTITTNLRYATAGNGAATSNLAPQPYFLNTKAYHFRTKLNPGLAVPAGNISVYSSSYDIGEGWTSTEIYSSSPLNVTLSDLHIYADGPPAKVEFAMAGTAFNTRTVRLKYNQTTILEQPLNYYNHLKKTIENVPADVSSNTDKAVFTFEIASQIPTDRVVVSHVSLTYPSKWNFNNSREFSFEMQPANTERLIEIENFNRGSEAPVLLNINSRRRYVGDITSKPGKVRFLLPSAMAVEEYQLLSLGTFAEVQNFEKVNFTNFADVANQGDYLIISNPLLFKDGQGKNQVQAYQQYRSSTEGGGYRAKIIDVNELIDQFAYGIKKHPGGIKDFIRFAMDKFQTSPRFVFLVGKGVSYDEYTLKQSSPLADKLNLVPTFGYPASDVLLVSPYGSAVPSVAVGRLSAVTGAEVGDYLAKMKEYEQKQKAGEQSLANRLWMKNVIQIIGGQDNEQSQEFRNYMNGYEDILADNLFGANVELFAKTSNSAVQLLRSKRVEEYFKEGISLISYFGHSSASVLDFNLNDPSAYDNPGKYPFFMVSGCTAGNNYIYDSTRLVNNNRTISESFVLAPNRGSIAFFASTHFGLPPQLNEYNTKYFKDAFINNYGKTVGEHQQKTIELVGGANPDNDYFTRTDFEEMTLHGDPAIKLNLFPKPDYVVEDQNIKIDPPFVSVSETKIILEAKIYNVGKAISDSISIHVKRTYPDGSSEIILTKRIAGVKYADSIRLEAPIISTRDKGKNIFTITADANAEVDELSEANNSYAKEVFVFEDEARPAYPADFAIVNKPGQKLYASTANPLAERKTYAMEIDTTALFNSPVKRNMENISAGGVIEFNPGISYQENTVYYWRVAVKPASGNEADYRWNKASFIYLPQDSTGANQSHYFQHLQSGMENISLNRNRKWNFSTLLNSIEVRNGVWPTAANQNSEMLIEINGTDFTRGICGVSKIVFNIIDPVSMKPLMNNTSGRFGSEAPCADNTMANFQYSILDANSRKAAMALLRDSVPDKYLVVARIIAGPNENQNTFAADWKADTALFGRNNSLYHALKENGFLQIDSFSRPRSFIFMYQKNNEEFEPAASFTNGIYDKISLTHPFLSVDTVGYITSPQFGPAVTWKEMQWKGNSIEAVSTDKPEVEIIGVDGNGNRAVLMTVKKGVDKQSLSAIDAKRYPYIQLRMKNLDAVNLSPYQLQFWRLYFREAPEGAIAPELFFAAKDTLIQGEPLDFGVAFQNISSRSFDSLKVKLSVIDEKNITRNLPVQKLKPLISGDSVVFKYRIDTRDITGANTLLVNFNPDNDQPEQYVYNNFIYRDFFVKADLIKPVLDVTFDGVHILNSDIVSAKPHILIKLKDENQFMSLQDTSLLQVQVRFPDKTVREYRFDNDTLRFAPPSGKDNEATIDFTPQFEGNDDEYELVVSGRDAVGNKAGDIDYHVKFRVFSKPMISNLLNYPNPFTTSTAFVFTVTGSDVPQNIRIQILTVTGKVVREITREELGPLHIGRNITEFKWDGTDMYGQKLANGVYLYRVLTNLNGKKLEKFRPAGDDTDKYFTSGYGKMYLMR